MFNNRKDPLIDSVKKVMAENETRRQAEFDLNEELGIASKRALPHEHHANYDALLEQRIAEALKGNQHKIDANQNGRVDGQDFKMLRAKKQFKEEIGRHPDEDSKETHQITFADKPGQTFTAMGKDPTKMSDDEKKTWNDKYNAAYPNEKGMKPNVAAKSDSGDKTSDAPKAPETKSSSYVTSVKPNNPLPKDDGEDEAPKAAEAPKAVTTTKAAAPKVTKTSASSSDSGEAPAAKKSAPSYSAKSASDQIGKAYPMIPSSYITPEKIKGYASSVGIKTNGDTIGGDRRYSAAEISKNVKNAYNYDVSPEKVKGYAKQFGVDIDEAIVSAIYECMINENIITSDLIDEATKHLTRFTRTNKINEAIGDKEGTAGTLRKNGKIVVPDTTANNPHMQASPDAAPMPPERPKDLDKQAPTPPARPKDLNEVSRNLARQVIRKASAEKEMGSKKDRSKAVELAGKKAYSIPSEPKVRATNEETIEENHVLYSHPKADIKVVRKGEGSKEGAAIEVHKGGKKVASGDYDHGADAFFVNVGGKGQKSFDTAKDIANHFHGLSEQFQQIDEMAPKGAKYERMVKHIKDKYSKDGKLSDKEKSIAYATAWKAKNKNMEEGLTAEQVMAEIRKNLGEDKFNEVNEGVWDAIKGAWNDFTGGSKPAETPNVTVGAGKDSREAQNQTTDTGQANRGVTTGAGTSRATGGAAERGNDERTAPTPAPSVDKNVDTGSGTAPSKPTTPAPKPAPKPAAPAASKDDIWDDSKIQRTGEGGTETAADFNRNSELYKKREAAGGQRPAPEAPKPATPAAPKPATPAAPKPATPTAPKDDAAVAGDNPMASMAAGRAAERGMDNRTNVATQNRLARPTKPTPIRESLNDAITKILKG